MNRKIMSLDEMFNDEDTRKLEETRAEIAKEKAEWDALPQAERDRINAAREDKLNNMFSAAESSTDEEEEEEEEDEDNFDNGLPDDDESDDDVRRFEEDH